MSLDRFELLCKMTRIGSEPLSTTSPDPPPVKFRPVYFKPDQELEIIDREALLSSRGEFNLDDEIIHSDLPFDGKHFFKDPLCPSYLKEDSNRVNEQSSTLSKPGRNMRACPSKKVSNAEKTVWGQMAARKQLLEQQRQEHIVHTKKESTDIEAAALVNNLLQQGFHITPPETTPMFNEYEFNSVLDNIQGDPIIAGRRQQVELVKSIHNELKRVKGPDLKKDESVVDGEVEGEAEKKSIDMKEKSVKTEEQTLNDTNIFEEKGSEIEEEIDSDNDKSFF